MRRSAGAASTGVSQGLTFPGTAARRVSATGLTTLASRLLFRAMRAAVIEKFNAPWVIKEIGDPTAAAGQVVIRVRASGLCGGDVHLYHGMFPLPPPIIAGLVQALSE